jgi:hypothetical protein
MICPLKTSTSLPKYRECDKENCQAWSSTAKYNPETKESEGDCRLFMLERKVSGGVSTHAY